MKNILIASFKKMWKLSLVLAVIGLYKWYIENPSLSSYEDLIRLIFGLIILILGPPLVVALALYLDDIKSKKRKGE